MWWKRPWSPIGTTKVGGSIGPDIGPDEAAEIRTRPSWEKKQGAFCGCSPSGDMGCLLASRLKEVEMAHCSLSRDETIQHLLL